MAETQETLYCMALTRAFSYHPDVLVRLYQQLGSATEIMNHRHHIGDVVPDATPKLTETLLNADNYLKCAEEVSISNVAEISF